MASKRSRTSRRKFTSEFKAAAVKLVLNHGVTQAQASRDLGVSESVLGRWVKEARQANHPAALAGEERQELQRLRRENAILRKEREILKNYPPPPRPTY